MTPCYQSFVLLHDLIKTNAGLTLSLVAFSAITRGQGELSARPYHAKYIGTITLKKINKVIHNFIAVGVRFSDHVSQIAIKACNSSPPLRYHHFRFGSLKK